MKEPIGMASAPTTENNIINDFYELNKLSTLKSISANTNEDIIFTHEDYIYGDIDDYNEEHIWALFVITRNPENRLVYRLYQRKIIKGLNASNDMAEYQETPVTPNDIDYISNIFLGSSHLGHF
jgi:hypothetical protein